MLCYVVQPQRLGVADQLAKDAVPARERTDDPPRLLVDAECQEALERTLGLVKDAERRVPGAGQLPGGLEKLIQNGLEIELGHQGTPHRQQPFQLLLAKTAAIGDEPIDVVGRHDSYTVPPSRRGRGKNTEAGCGRSAMNSAARVAIIVVL